MRINGIQFPPGMGLSEFLKLSKEGMQDYTYGSLANPIAQSEDLIPERMNLLQNLNNELNLENIPGDQITESMIRDALNKATYGNTFGNIFAQQSHQNMIDNGVVDNLEYLSSETGLPIWQLNQNNVPITSDLDNLSDEELLKLLMNNKA